LDEKEKFIRDYILNKRYIEKEDDDQLNESADDDNDDENKDKIVLKKTSEPLDYVELSEDEKIMENLDDFERKYNFRYEDPDPEFIKAYPRTMADSVRRKSNKRKEKREDYKKRKEQEKQRKKEELKRLKSLKKKEIVDKIEKLKKISGLDNFKLNIEDLEKDFDPDEYAKKMDVNKFKFFII
jgi:protein KRI1